MNLKGGTLQWNVLDFHLMEQLQTGQWPGEDLITIIYPTCVIDVGWYGGKNGLYCIKVIEKNTNITETYFDGSPVIWNWVHPYADIPCLDLDDMYSQLQRAIDIYPEQISNK